MYIFKFVSMCRCMYTFHIAVVPNNWMHPFTEGVPIYREKSLHYFSFSSKARKIRTGKVTNLLMAETACI